MLVLRCSPDRAPLPSDAQVPSGASPSASPLGLRLLTPLIRQIWPQCQAFRLSLFFSFFFFFFGVSWPEPGFLYYS